MSCSSRCRAGPLGGVYHQRLRRGNQYLPALRRQPERFEPHSRERLLAGAMIPSAWYIQAQRFRAHARQAFKALFARPMC
jgi:Asp-tRNA(Asn)/Glu-tRNA(Gln) amidotransferase A subunit family amidase